MNQKKEDKTNEGHHEWMFYTVSLGSKLPVVHWFLDINTSRASTAEKRTSTYISIKAKCAFADCGAVYDFKYK